MEGCWVTSIYDKKTGYLISNFYGNRCEILAHKYMEENGIKMEDVIYITENRGDEYEC